MKSKNNKNPFIIPGIALIVGMLLFAAIDQANTKRSPKRSIPTTTAPTASFMGPCLDNIHCLADSICKEVGVPPGLVYEIGLNESGWTCIQSLSGGSDYGDLQVIETTFKHWYDRLDLEGGPTRINYLTVGIYYLRHQYNYLGTWEKARFAYARGYWRPPSTWTPLEHRFMNKIDFNKYDNGKS